MKILITGGTGFIAKNIGEYLGSEFDVDCFGRSKLDLLDIPKDSLIKYDAVVHCAIQGGTYRETNTTTFYNNLLMVENLINSINEDTILINIGSGAEFVRVGTGVPTDYYGLSKRIISKIISSREKSYNLRIFGCFGYGENENRFLNKCINSNQLTINKNVLFDYFYVDDLSRVIKFFLLNQKFVNDRRRSDLLDINCVYEKKRSLLDMAEFVKKKYNNNLLIKVNDNEIVNWKHSGSGNQIKKIENFMDDKIIGFEEGVKEYYEKH